MTSINASQNKKLPVVVSILTGLNIAVSVLVRFLSSSAALVIYTRFWFFHIFCELFCCLYILTFQCVVIPLRKIATVSSEKWYKFCGAQIRLKEGEFRGANKEQNIANYIRFDYILYNTFRVCLLKVYKQTPSYTYTNTS